MDIPHVFFPSRPCDREAWWRTWTPWSCRPSASRRRSAPWLRQTTTDGEDGDRARIPPKAVENPMENLWKSWSDCWYIDMLKNLLDVGCSWVELAVEPWECHDANCAVQQICLLPTSVFDVTWRRSMINLKDAMPSSYHAQHFAARSFAFKRKSRRSGVVYVTLHTQNIGHISAPL